jgi:hypothetical protein
MLSLSTGGDDAFATFRRKVAGMVVSGWNTLMAQLMKIASWSRVS